jgi:signal transduction histidine kinase
MRSSDSPFVADWFVVSLRWLALLGLSVSLSRADSLMQFPNLILILLTFWNIALTLLAGLNRRMPHHREYNLAVDTVCAAAYFFAQGGLAGAGFWVIVIPILSGAIYFDLLGGLLIAGAMALIEFLTTWLMGHQLTYGLIAAGITVLTGAIFGFISQKLIEDLRHTRAQQLNEREKNLQVENNRLRAIYNLTSTLTATLNYKRVLDTALDLGVKALNAGQSEEDLPRDDRLTSAVLLFSGDELVVGSARRFTQQDMRATAPGRQGLLAQAIENGETILYGSVRDDPELARFVGLHQCESVYCFPLRSGFNAYGVLIFGHPEADYFNSDRRDVLDVIGRQAVIAIQNSRLYQDLADEKNRIVEVQEEARKKLARDLHDGPTQSVAAMAMRINLARRMLEKDPASVMEELVRIEELARRTTKEIRHMLFTLRPLVLESQGLAAALQQMAEKMKETFAQEVIIQVDDKLASELEVGKSGVIFYIVEEAVTNARKHAQAPHIWARLGFLPKDKEIALLEIADDGVGFDVESVNKSYDKRGSLGMINLRERAELVNGLLHIDSAPGKGARVRVFIPLTEEASDRLHHGR